VGIFEKLTVNVYGLLLTATGTCSHVCHWLLASLV